MVGLSELVREKNLGLLSIVADLNDKVFNEDDKVNIAENKLWLVHGESG
jgi:hypothetical protein